MNLPACCSSYEALLKSSAPIYSDAPFRVCDDSYMPIVICLYFFFFFLYFCFYIVFIVFTFEISTYHTIYKFFNLLSECHLLKIN